METRYTSEFLALKKPILVTGANRSGTTWVGNILARSPHIKYIPEIFNPSSGLLRGHPATRFWFHHITEDPEELYRPMLNKIIKGKYPFINIFRFMDAKKRFSYKGVRSRFKLFLNSYINHEGRYRFLIKDPIALFSTEWLSKEFNIDILITIRHPAAFVYSIKRVNWRFDVDNFLKQRTLMEDYLYPFESKLRKIKEKKMDIIEEASTLWTCFYHVVNLYRENHPEWIFKKHEDLSLNPIDEFQQICMRLNIPFSINLQKAIKEFCSSNNPTEAPEKIIHQLKRNSRENISIWKKRLSQNEIHRIRNIVDRYSANFYSPAEW
ncbi:sulfotransferase [Desulfococcus multivorans]|uniref:Sulfotransferase n=1 Tax=Desulfococcus multivorans DSM 2059 TaxID=1121405 RepID=S7VDN8_DESML|nr:sulfotransferase [Desulfococcus multivorans]AOY60128.1 conserved uncharacterized protein [Desulfococcus multivorans]AQV02263.1 sulfotransferase family protein [Desulfococcus multivorans]EPR44809.1 hypothetical protein dsmv_3782 [Desulfococcus multivorans DSM 2059]SKA28985.1 Sulfotransferase family protein [Desulfococcus multivorans DSM 2059]